MTRAPDEGLIGYGVYVPYFRLRRAEIAAVLGEGGGTGTRTVASYDEDSTSMGVEAARAALRGLPPAALPRRVYLATATPPYLDHSNAAVVHAALGLDRTGLAVDMAGAPRSAVGAVLAAIDAPVPALAVLSDVRTGLAGGSDERDGGDAAAALLFGPGGAGSPVLAEVLACASTTDEVFDRWRTPGATASRVWEERFGEHVYRDLVASSFDDALKEAGISASDVDHLVVAGMATRAARQFARASGVRADAQSDDLTALIGNPGTAQPGVLLADALDRAAARAVVAVVVVGEGATTLLVRTTEALGPYRRDRATVAVEAASGNDTLRYATFLAWRGQLHREPPRRPDPDPPASPPAHRSGHYKYGFRGSRCEDCGTIQLPPARTCVACGALDRMAEIPMADVPGTISTYTVDRLAYTPSPPMVAAVIDFDGGGRFRCELTDVDPEAIGIGDRVAMTFRRLLTANGIHNYFWKARPLSARDSVPADGPKAS